MNKVLVLQCGVSESTGALLYSFYHGQTAAEGRFMQGAARSPYEALLYQASATLVELLGAEALLKGNTPMHGVLVFFAFLRRYFTKTNEVVLDTILTKKPSNLWTSKVFSLTAIHDLEKEVEKRVKAERDEKDLQRLRKIFCSSAMMVNSHAEGSTILSIGAVFLSVPANLPGRAGSPAISWQQVVVNICIMCFGKFVSDGIIFLMSGRMTKRYFIDLSLEYKVRVRWKHALVLLTISLVQVKILLYNLTILFCFTSEVGKHEDQWVITSCPEVPNGRRDMLKIGNTYRH